MSSNEDLWHQSADIQYYDDFVAWGRKQHQTNHLILLKYCISFTLV